jgi:hypothetical protein
VKPFITTLILLGGLLGQSAFFAPAHAAGGSVGAELVIPPAETYVIGDSIPLHWRFTNQSTDPLGFMWEGCCRVNGRLTITRNGQVVQPIPPGQALAHMFAKAEVLAPGKARDFDSFLSDWVQLPETGTYELYGRYTGVLDFQKPQVPRGVNLWRDGAATPTNRLSVVSVTDYLQQREQRAKQRGLVLEFSGPAKFPLLGATDWALRVRNVSGESRVVRWPDDFSVWLVNEKGFREMRVPSAIDGDYTEITVPPGQNLDRTIRLDYGRLEGEPLGQYQLFIDLKTATNGLPRVASNPLPLNWTYTAEDVAQLVLKAASGNKAGLRNPALKFLRVYLGELAPALKVAQVPAGEEKAKQLLAELKLGSALKIFAPQPGRKDWALSVNESGAWRLAEDPVRASFPANLASIEQAQQLLRIRRHLGLEMSFTLQPEEKAPAATWFSTAQALAPVLEELVSPVHLRALPQSTNNTGIVNVRQEATPANVGVLVIRSNAGLKLGVARKIPDAQSPQLTTTFSPGDLKSMTTISSPAQLLEFINDPRLRSLQVQVFCPPATTWSELRQALEPLWTKVNQVDLALAP